MIIRILLVVALVVLISPFTPDVNAAGPDEMIRLAPPNPAFKQYINTRTLEAFQDLNAAGIQDGSGFPSIAYLPPIVDLSHLDALSDFEFALSDQTSSFLPSAFDWRDQGKVTPVKNQGAAGTCWAFGTLAPLESRLAVVDNMLYDLSEQNLVLGVDTSWVSLAADRANAGGNALMATDELVRVGARPETDQPYNSFMLNSDSFVDNTDPLLKVTDFRIVVQDGATSAGTDLIKSAIQTYGPVLAAYYHNGSHYNWDTHIYTYPNCTVEANHMVCLVGWDDSIGDSGAWIAKNSWGPGWGEGGYFYLCYGSANLQTVGSFHGGIANPSGYTGYDSSDKYYYWDEAGWVGSVGTGDSPSCWMRNVFTSANTGTLKSIGFWTTADNARYEINVRDSFNSLLSGQTGVCDESGYYTLPLETPVALTAGQEYKIDVKMTTPGYDFPIAVEMQYIYQGEVYADPPIQSGVSYVKLSDNEDWIDLAASGYNACLRAIVQDNALSVNTQAATAVTTSSATLNGSLGDSQDRTPVNVYFEYGTTTQYGQTTDIQSIAAPGVFSAVINSLTSNTNYHFRLVVSGSTPQYGGDITFNTLKASPSIITSSASGITYNSSILNGKLNDPGDYTSVKVYFQYGASTKYNRSTASQSLTSAGNFTAGITGLSAGVTYHFRAVALGDVAVYGLDSTFTTLSSAPVATTLPATALGAQTAIINGALDSMGASTGVRVYFQYGTTTRYGKTTASQKLASTGNISAPLTKLTDNTTYHYRIVAVGAGTAYGKDMTFTTLKSAPSITVLAAFNVSKTTATLKGVLDYLGASSTVRVSFQYGTSTKYNRSTTTQMLKSIGAFQSNIANLKPGTTYHFRIKAVGKGTVYSKDMVFTTPR